MKFSEIELHPKIVEGIKAVGYDNCTPVQELCIPLILDGKDVAGLAQTGTGKTAAFLIPLIDRLLRSRSGDPEEKRRFKEYNPSNFILVLVPTRELADQISANVESLGKPAGITYVTIYGGTGCEKQKAGLKDGVDFVIATPGRLLDLYKENLVDLRLVRALVFDEADRMFDMGFKDDMEYILTRIPRDRQFLVFSATLNFDGLNTAYKFGAGPVEVNINRDQAKAENVTDTIIHIGEDEKASALLTLLKRHNPKQVMVFSNFKNKVERLAQFLNDNGYSASAISSLQSQAQRTQVISRFKEQHQGSILVATDVAARGLDITGVDLVVNFELPDDPETYVHRIGRTGRAGETGTAVSLVSDRDVYALGRIEDYTKLKLNTGWIEDEEWVKDFKPLQRERNRFFKPKPMTPFSPAGGGNNRGPRRGGPNRRPDDRGPRRDNRDNRPMDRDASQNAGGGSPNAGARNDGNRDQRPQQARNPNSRGPRPAHGNRNDNRNGNRNEGRSDGRADNRPDLRKREGARPEGGNRAAKPWVKKDQSANGYQNSQKPKAGGRYRVVDKPAQASVTGKVTGFLKKLLGLKTGESSVVVSRGGHSGYKKPNPAKKLQPKK